MQLYRLGLPGHHLSNLFCPLMLTPPLSAHGAQTPLQAPHYLPLTVHNNSGNTTTGFPPSQLLVGWEPPLTPEQGEKSNNLMAEQHAENL